MLLKGTCQWLFTTPERVLLCTLNALAECVYHGDAKACPIAEDREYNPDIKMWVSEIYPAISGEGLSTGAVCTIVRTVGCNLRCKYCDSQYAYEGGEQVTLGDVVAAVLKFGIRKVLFTGGEPLLNEQVATNFLRAMMKHEIVVYIETNGSVNIWPCKMLGHIVMDIKTPSSGMHEKMHWDNLTYLGPTDEVKFVVSDQEDYSYARQVIMERGLSNITSNIFISPAWSGDVKFYQNLSQWMIRDRSEARLMLQQHKVIWGATRRGV